MNATILAAVLPEAKPVTINPTPVKVRVMHIDPHLDELGADYMAALHGTERLPGIKEAKLRCVGQGPLRSQEECDRMGLILFGCGFGRYDDHAPTGDRKPGCSSIKLVLDDLGVTDTASLMLGREVHWCDINPGVSSTQFANLVKSYHRYFPTQVDELVIWVKTAFDAVREQLAMPFTGEQDEYTAVKYFEGVIQAGWFKDKKFNKERILKLLEKSAENARTPTSERTFYTEIAFIIQALQRNGKSHEEVYDWIGKAFVCLVNDEILFVEALDEVRDGRNRLSIQLDKPTRQGHSSLRFCVLHTDNPMALAAANFCRQQVIMLRNPRGQVQVFIDRTTGLNLDIVTGMMRWMESTPEMRAGISFPQMCTTDGSMVCAPHIHYRRTVGQTLNGTPTHPNVPAMRTPSHMIVNSIRNAFHAKYISQWINDHGVAKKTTH